MSDDRKSFVPTELVGVQYRPIGGTYDSALAAIEALGHHFNNRHGGGGSFRTYRADDSGSHATIVEAATPGDDAMAIRALYKVIERPA